MSKPQLRMAEDGQRALPRKINFTAAALQAAACPPGKDRVYVYDSRQAGLALMITASGARSFYVYRKVGNKPERIRLGGFPDITIEQARKLAARTIGQIADGADPMAERQAARQAVTLGELWDAWKTKHADERLTANTLRTDVNRYEHTLKSWAGRKLAAITPEDVVRLHAELGQKHGHVQANRGIQLMRRLFRYAGRVGYKLEDPTRTVELFSESSRERYVTAAELPALMKAIDGEDPIFADFFRVALFTGARRSNVQGMAWSEIDLDNRTWLIPGKRAKKKVMIMIHLSEPVVEILKRRQQEQQDARAEALAKGKIPADEPPCPWVFPSRGKTGHLVEVKTAWQRIVKQAGLDGVRVHDLRRTLGSWQAAAGVSLPIIGKSLGHASTRSTEIYSRLDLAPVRPGVDAAAAAMLQAAQAKPNK